MLHYYIGTDEAGYGPNLGPLLICATLWESKSECESELDPENLYEPLSGIISPDSVKGGAKGGEHRAVRIADSKQVHDKKNPGTLEKAVFIPARTIGIQPRDDLSLWADFAPGAAEQQEALPWYDGVAQPVPTHADLEEIESHAARLADRFDETGLRLKRILATAVYPRRFNAIVEETGSKGVLLSNETMRLAATLASDVEEGTIHVTCDKHGGRNKYRPLLEAHFEDAFVEIYEEGRHRSHYRFGPTTRRFEFTFRTKAEACLPVALASCVAKYLRERAMDRVNAFWRGHLPDLKPTAGYPVDAKRFLTEIEAKAEELGIEKGLFWRNR